MSDRLFARAAAAAIPLAVHFDLTNRCNEDCVHCYRVVEDRPELTTGEVCDALDQLAGLATMFVTFSGGEPLLRPDLFTILARARAHAFDCRLKTNALRVTPAVARELRRLGVREVHVSIYHVRGAVHDAITGVDGSLDRSLRGIRNLRAAGVRVRLSCPLTRLNAGAHRRVRSLAEELGAGIVFDPNVTPRVNGDRGPLRLRVTRRQLRRVLLDRKLAPRLAVRPVVDDPRFERPCGAGHNSCYISPYGDVFPCVQMPLHAGNLRAERLAAIWSAGRTMVQVRAIRESDLPACRRCLVQAFCQRCPGRALVEDGDLLGPSSSACREAVIRAELLSRRRGAAERHAAVEGISA